MNEQFSKNPIKKKRKEKHIKKLTQEGRMVKGVVIPQGALPANPDEQDNYDSYAAKFFYKDITYTCAGCGKEEVWTAKQQKRYFEEQKGNIYNKPKWCYDCHSKNMQAKQNKQAE